MPGFFFSSLWYGLTLWIILYISDYILTLTCARLYKSGVDQVVVIQGSYELNPLFQRDIDSLRPYSPRFITMLIMSASLLSFVWFFWAKEVPEVYECILGTFILVEGTVHIRHFRNFFLFRATKYSNEVRGRIEYSRRASLNISSLEFLAFAGLFSLIFAFTRSWFVLGGALGCLSTAIKNYRLARKASQLAATRAEPLSSL